MRRMDETLARSQISGEWPETSRDELSFSQQDSERDLKLAELGPLDPAEMVDGYNNARLELVFKVRSRGINGEAREYVAICKRAASGVETNLGSFRDWRDPWIVQRPRSHCGDYYESVLVGVVEVPQDGEQGGRCVLIPSVVRLQTFDLGLNGGGERIKSPSLGGELVRTVGDRERELRGSRGILPIRCSNRNGVDEVIEDTADIVNTITAQQRPLIKWQLSLKVDTDGIDATFRIMMTTDGVQVFAHLIRHGSLEGFVVFPRPV